MQWGRQYWLGGLLHRKGGNDVRLSRVYHRVGGQILLGGEQGRQVPRGIVDILGGLAPLIGGGSRPQLGAPRGWGAAGPGGAR